MEEEPTESVIATNGDGFIWCSRCNVSLGTVWNKSIKQHQRSKLHKKGPQTKAKRTKKSRQEDVDNGDEDEGDDGAGGDATTDGADVQVASMSLANIQCMLCHLMGEIRNHYPFTSENTNYCMAPPIVDKPSIRTTPFITKQGGCLPLYPDCLEDVIQNYCVGKASRMPNIDINHECCEVKSLSEARKILKDAKINKDTYWCALAVDDHLENPNWWPSCSKVPGYTQLIIASGPTDIGIHLDVYGKEKVPVDTYLTICRGVKQVCACCFASLYNLFQGDNVTSWQEYIH